VHNVVTNTATYVGGTGAIYDFYPNELTADPGVPNINLSKSSLSFQMEIGSDPVPAEAAVEVTNGSGSTTLDGITVSGRPAWLNVAVSGSGNSQTITNSINMAEVSGEGEFNATITVTAGNAEPSSKTYSVRLTVSQPVPQEPYSGTPTAIPGTVEAEDYDNGGEGKAYHDTDAGNSGGAYRTDEGVDVESCSEGGHNVGWIETGEWLEYTVTVAEDANYDVSLRVASQSGGGQVHVECDGQDLTGTVDIGSTGGWSTWKSVGAGSVRLAPGEHVIRVVADNGGFNLNSTTFDVSSEPVPVTVLSPSTDATVVVGEQLVVEYDANCDLVPGVKMELSLDGGLEWILIETSGTLDCGQHTWEWTVPETVADAAGEQVSTLSEQCVIRVSNYMGSGGGLSGTFAIRSLDPVGGEQSIDYRGVVCGPRRGVQLVHRGTPVCRIPTSSVSAGDLVVMRLDGRIVLSQPADASLRSHIDISNLCPGTYVVHVTASGISRRFTVFLP
jgi:hypothetical protein